MTVAANLWIPAQFPQHGLGTESWPAIEYRGWRHLEDTVAALVGISHGARPVYLFRGVSDCRYELEPSLLRLLRGWGVDRITSATIEKRLLQEIQAAGHLHAPVQDYCPTNSVLEWLFVMQHYRAPTRLLDWTSAPYIAALFAATEAPGQTGCIWVVNHLTLQKVGSTDWLERFRSPSLSGFEPDSDPDPKKITSVSPARHSERSLVQSSWMTIAASLEQDHGQAIAEILPADTAADAAFERHLYFRILIPPSKKQELCKELYVRGISSRTVFPGLEGVCQSLRDLVITHQWDYARLEEWARKRHSHPSSDEEYPPG